MSNNTVGIYDYDYFHKTNFLSLEVMKIANYWSSKRKMVSITSDPNPDLFSKFYYASDLGDIKDVPNFNCYNNIELVGHTFWKKYNHQLPSEIEQITPNPEVYPDLLNHIKLKTTAAKNKIFTPKRVYGGLHFRLDNITQNQIDLVNQSCQLDYPAFFIYNYDITEIKNWIDIIQELRAGDNDKWRPKQNYPFFLNMKFPINITNRNFGLLETLKYDYLHGLIGFNVNEVLSLEQYRYIQSYVKKCREEKHNYKIAKWYNRKIIYRPFFDTSRTILSKRIKDFLFQCLEMRNTNTIFSLKKDRNFFENEGWKDFFYFMIDYANYDTVHYTMENKSDIYTEEELKEQIPDGTNIRYGKNISISNYLWWRFHTRTTQKQKIAHRNIVSKMNLIIKTQPETEVLFRCKPKEVSKYDWTRN